MIKKIWDRLIIELSHLMVYKYPPFIIVRPELHNFKGKPYSDLMDLLSKGKILPGDIFLRKSHASITSGMVPGHFSHAGLYVGINSNAVPSIIHAMSDGVKMASVYDFCRTDELMIVRPRHIPKVLIEKVVHEAYKYLGCPYDFDFRYSNDHKFYCFELVGRCYEVVKPRFKFKLSTVGFWFFKKKALLSDDIINSDVDIIFEAVDD